MPVSSPLGNFLVEWKQNGITFKERFILLLGNFLVEWKQTGDERFDRYQEALETS